MAVLTLFGLGQVSALVARAMLYYLVVKLTAFIQCFRGVVVGPIRHAIQPREVIHSMYYYGPVSHKLDQMSDVEKCII